MKRIALLAVAVLVLMGSGRASASWGQLTYSGYQPWYNIFAKRYKCITPEEERLQKFWHDYYNALKCYYSALDSIDWVAYYKNHGYAINCSGPGGSCGRINYAPVFVSPTMQWAAPSTPMGGQPQAMPSMMGGAGFGPSVGMAYPPPGAGYPPMGMGMPGPGFAGPGMPGPGMPGPGMSGPGMPNGMLPTGY